ncbi:hypothetical protein BBP40_003172 [Aspergillus hancockii]|nr:hypothetical protein BBP40_003172 [Aspergillus hancockii]
MKFLITSLLPLCNLVTSFSLPDIRDGYASAIAAPCRSDAGCPQGYMCLDDGNCVIVHRPSDHTGHASAVGMARRNALSWGHGEDDDDDDDDNDDDDNDDDDNDDDSYQMADPSGIMDPFQCIPAQFLGYMLMFVPDLPSLLHRLHVSPTVSAVFNEPGIKAKTFDTVISAGTPVLRFLMTLVTLIRSRAYCITRTLSLDDLFIKFIEPEARRSAHYAGKIPPHPTLVLKSYLASYESDFIISFTSHCFDKLFPNTVISSILLDNLSTDGHGESERPNSHIRQILLSNTTITPSNIPFHTSNIHLAENIISKTAALQRGSKSGEFYTYCGEYKLSSTFVMPLEKDHSPNDQSTISNF